MRPLLALLLCASLASAEDVTRTVVFKTTPPDASVVQLLPGGQKGEIGTAGVEMEVRVPLEGHNVSEKALEFEASLPGHKALQFKMDTRGPSYNMNVNAPIEYTVIEHLQPDGSLSGGVDYVKANPVLVVAALATLLGGVGAGVYLVKARKTQAVEAAAAVAARPDPKSYLDRQVEGPAPVAAAPPPPEPEPAPTRVPPPGYPKEPAIPETDDYLDHQLPPPDYAMPKEEPKVEEPEPVKADEPVVEDAAAEISSDEAEPAAGEPEKKGKKRKK